MALFPRAGSGSRSGIGTRILNQGFLGITLTASVALIGAFVLYPFVRVLGHAATSTSAEQWRALFVANQTSGVIWNTVRLGLLVGLTSTIVGLAMALVQVRTKFRFKRLLHILTILPVFAPPFAVSMSVITLFGRNGLISQSLLGARYDITGLDGLVLAISVSFMPIAYLNFVGMLLAVDGSIEEAATDLGASLSHRLRTIILPLLVPGIASSFLLVFASAISDLGNAVLLGGDYEVLSSQIYLAVIGEFNLDKASVLSVMLLVPSLVVFSTQYFWLRKRQYVTVTGRPVSAPKLIVQRSFSWPLCGLAVLVMTLVVLLYGYIVVGAFTEVWNINFSPTFRHISYVTQGSGREAFFDTIRLALLSTAISGAAGLTIANAIVSKRRAWSGVLDFASLLGAAIPGTMIGLGLLLAYNTNSFTGWLPQLNRVAILIVLAFTVRSLPGVVRVTVASLDQLSSNIAEASISLGATPTQTFLRVTLPLVRPAVLSSMLWSFTRSMTTLSPIVFFVSPQWRIVTVQILNEADQGRFGEAAAYSLIMMVVVLVSVSLRRATGGIRLLIEGSPAVGRPAHSTDSYFRHVRTRNR